ncbi:MULTISPECIES: transposase [Agrobacterium]|uniref:Transposase n=5 Tax=Agrobacterium TaxID=357 RepID=A0AAE6BI50_AGRTU|nr:hypothetical protein [Agrobacterium genomosp. 6]ASK40877.1 hypothetical protein [Agrobacterium genomosp. 6]ASK41465.1 hypothetical protein [Agrobacterium genomosp. 6]QCL77628.1 hypothetical protein CFBP5499_29010 [Agrobacterium tumefaciens]QCL83093.1 hypothetical protein CFBP5877_28175 [Agrobacterium tumefaciens]
MTSVKCRRRWPREDKERLVAACFEPGAVISEIACADGINVSQSEAQRCNNQAGSGPTCPRG